MEERIEKILQGFPFLTYGRLLETNYLGIIQNADTKIISMYVMDGIPTQELRRSFLEAGMKWWWNSNRHVPINIFLKEDFLIYRPYLKHFPRKDFEIIGGPIVSLQENMARRVRKRQITLVKRM